MDLVVTDAGPYRDGSITFMSRNPDEHHQLVLVSGRRPEDTYSPGGQISFRVQSLEDVQYFHAAASERGLRELRSSDHGNAWSIYFLDPEGNRIEVYAPSPVPSHHPNLNAPPSYGHGLPPGYAPPAASYSPAPAPQAARSNLPLFAAAGCGLLVVLGVLGTVALIALGGKDEGSASAAETSRKPDDEPAISLPTALPIQPRLSGLA
jgi:hypothetical protein